MERINHHINHIRRWYESVSFVRFLASAGLIPITNQGITYDAEIRLNEGGPMGHFDSTLKYASEHTLSLSPNVIESRFDMKNGTYSESRKIIIDDDMHFKTKTVSNKMTLKNFDHFKGGAGNDTAYGTNGENRFDGNTGKNYFNGRGGNDTFYFTWGENVIIGGAGDRDVAETGSYFEIVDLIERAVGDPVGENNVDQPGKYVVAEIDGRKNYIHESTELIEKVGRRSATSMTFQDAWESIRVEVRDPDQNATREYDLIGSDKSEDFYSGTGRDNIIGNAGKDEFHLTTFGNHSYQQNADRIMDMAADDKIIVHASQLGLDPAEIELAVTNSRQERLALEENDTNFFFSRELNALIHDTNGSQVGGGAVIAYLTGTSTLDSPQLQIEFI